MKFNPSFGVCVLTISLTCIPSIRVHADEVPTHSQSCRLDVIAGFDGQGIRIHSDFQKTSDSFLNASGVLTFVGDHSNEIPLTHGSGHLANEHTGVLQYSGENPVLLVIDWKSGSVTSGSIGGLPILPSLTNTVSCDSITPS